MATAIKPPQLIGAYTEPSFTPLSAVPINCHLPVLEGLKSTVAIVVPSTSRTMLAGDIEKAFEA